MHRRKGDPDNTSHRGHPICKYCDSRYLDRDELFRHLRREHYFCHFCDADGANQFYGDYSAMRDHFKAEHFLCEEGECAEEQFTAVFRTDIDLRAHKANTHGRSLGKVATKQARTLEFEFTLAPRNRNNNNQNGGGGTESSSRGSMRIRNDQQIEFDGDNFDEIGITQHHHNPQRTLNSQNEQEFPSLGNNSSHTAVTLVNPNMSIRAKAYGSQSLVKSKENFPALGGQNKTLDPGPSLTAGQYSKSSASAILKKSYKNGNNDNSSSGNSGGPSMVIHVSNRPNSSISASGNSVKPGSSKSGNDFPALMPSNNIKNFKYMDMDSAPPNITQPLLTSNIIAAKHKSLVGNDYQSTTKVLSKMTLVQKDNQVNENGQSHQQSSFNVNPPKLSSADNFPALSATNAPAFPLTSVTKQWVVPKQPKESKKTKVATAPILTSTTTTTSNTSNNQNGKKMMLINSNTKKTNQKVEPKKEVKQPQQKEQSSGKVNTATTSAKEMNNNSIKTTNQSYTTVQPKKQPIPNNMKSLKYMDMDETAPSVSQPLLTSNVIAAKHKSLVGNDYQSQTKITSKMTLIQKDENKNGHLPISQSQNQVQITDDNFPSLSKKGSSSSSSNSLPPPGFNINSNKQKTADVLKPPPPGFSVTLNSVARTPSNNLTFTNSLGESYNIRKTYNYVAPANAVKRNQVNY